MILPTSILFVASETAQSSEAGGSVLDALGVDPKLLVFQLIAFSILVWLLSKYVFPVLMKSVDDRQATIEQSTLAAVQAEKHAAEAQKHIDAALAKARREATDIVMTAKEEAAGLLAKSEEKSKTQAERIVAEAHETIAKDVLAAKKALHNETIELVAQATEKLVGKVLDGKADKALIANTLKETA